MTISKTHELKQLRTRLAKAEAEERSAGEEVKVAQKRQAEVRKLAGDLRARISQLEGKSPVITEHALLRYFERVLGYDLEAVANGLMTDQVKAMLSQMPNGKIPSVGCRLVAKDGVIVTLET
jgi:hypothetical protein